VLPLPFTLTTNGTSSKQHSRKPTKEPRKAIESRKLSGRGPATNATSNNNVNFALLNYHFHMNELLQIFQNVSPISDEDQTLISENWTEEVQLERNDFLVDLGVVERRIYFIEEGTLRIYYPNNGDEIVVGFGYPNTVICDFPSLINSTASGYCIQALKRCKLRAISGSVFFEIKSKSSAIERCWQLMTEQALIGKIERETEMLTFTPQQRVERLRTRSPHVFQLIPGKYIASYLRMTPETLSRIHGKS
jgi:CRP-like cAMP-binding protein